MSIVADVCAQPTSIPQLPREAQEIVSAAAETIRQDKTTIAARSERIKMMRDQLESAQTALDLAIQNGNLCEEVRQNQLAEIKFLKDQYADMKHDRNKERRRKIFWKCASVVLAGTSVYFLLL